LRTLDQAKEEIDSYEEQGLLCPPVPKPSLTEELFPQSTKVSADQRIDTENIIMDQYLAKRKEFNHNEEMLFHGITFGNFSEARMEYLQATLSIDWKNKIQPTLDLYSTLLTEMPPNSEAFESLANYICNPYPRDEQERLVFDNERFQITDRVILLQIIKSMRISKLDPIVGIVVTDIAMGHQDTITNDIGQSKIPAETLPIIREVLGSMYVLSHKFVGDTDHHGKYGNVNNADINRLMKMIRGAE
jgi:hypothetical protein